MKKKIFGITLGVIVLLLAALAVYHYVQSARHGEAVIPDAAVAVPENPALGDVVSFSAECVIPWGQNISGLAFDANKGWIAYLTDSHFRGIELAGRRITAVWEMRPVVTGKTAPGQVRISMERPMFADGTRKFEKILDLPELSVRPLEIAPGSELPLAGALPPPQRRSGMWLWISVVAFAVALMILLAWLMVQKRARRTEPGRLPPWEIARSELAALQQTADAGDRALSWCVARLTDVVRDYLSARFQWPVKQQTTGEFLNSLRRDRQSPLSAEQMHSLGDFMNAADLVKFAKMEPDAGYFADAMHRAEALIDETRPRETPENGKEGTK